MIEPLFATAPARWPRAHRHRRRLPRARANFGGSRLSSPLPPVTGPSRGSEYSSVGYVKACENVAHDAPSSSASAAVSHAACTCARRLARPRRRAAAASALSGRPRAAPRLAGAMRCGMGGSEAAVSHPASLGSAAASLAPAPAAARAASCRGAPRAARARLPAPRKGGRASAEGARLQRPTECVRARGVGGARQCDGVAARQASKQHLAIWRKPPRGMKREANEARATLYPTQSLAACRLSPRAPRPCVCSDLRSQIRSKGNAPTQLVACRLSPRALPRLYTRAHAQMSHVRSQNSDLRSFERSICTRSICTAALEGAVGV